MVVLKIWKNRIVLFFFFFSFFFYESISLFVFFFFFLDLRLAFENNKIRFRNN
jgi:hypothetical protein